MNRSRWVGMAGLSMVATLATAIGACTADYDPSADAPAGEGSGAGSSTSSGDGYSSSYASTTSDSTGTGSGDTGSGSFAPDPGADDAGAPDAAASTCDQLDPEKSLVLYLSADDSNSMASPVRAREALRIGSYINAGEIRTYEFLNYYRIQYPAAPTDGLSLFPVLDTTPSPGELALQIGVRSEDAAKPRRPITVTFVLDTSGSMGGHGMDREKATVSALAASLASGDIVNMVTWSTQNQVILDGHQVSGPNDPTLLQAADDLEAGGGTDLHGGLVAGYNLAKQHYGDKRLNRVVLVSDGGANVGITDEDLIADNSLDGDKEGIYLVGVGTGPSYDYNDLLMDVVTDKGRGAYVYLDEPEEAAAMFKGRFDETMEVAARGVQVELTLPWYFEMFKFYGEEYSPDATAIEPQHLAPGDAMIFDQVLKACDPSVIDTSDVVGIRVTWESPLSYIKHETTLQMTVGELLDVDKSTLRKGMAIVGYAEALKAGTKDQLHAAFDAVVAANPSGTDVELNEIAELIQLHAAF